ncbi:ATP-binding cassette domain-containing protein [Fibrella sp. HMF5335]|uniref:ATP-binding cassette domain-containing protein n=1 Tax=Fibrella rubiginis TaxID=2817060 RepID=A0A939K6V9_9BACT|nr:ATP-binding cassette domain-containing protein [Fibrella rubiginis]MBO0937975.1 ATP-binding cassette domain-containing protein [Fibrella rubiginis]
MIQLENALFRKGLAVVLRDINLVLEPGQHWAIIGPTGAGKSLLLEALAGQLLPQAGQFSFSQNSCSDPRITREQHKARTALVTFRAASHAFDYGRFFYQQRYHAGLEESLDVQAFLGLQNDQLADSERILSRLGLLPLLSLPFIKLSNGQSRKVLIAKALLNKPALLLLDDPFVGLDAAMRQDLVNWLDELMNAGTQLVLVAPPDVLPMAITHVIDVAYGQVVSQRIRPETGSELPVLGIAETATPPLPNWQTPPMPPLPSDRVFDLRDVTVRYGDSVILDQLNWTVRVGERWALLGPNGSGKSVLLSLLYGDHPQAYANDIRLFGKPHGRGRTGTGQSIWSIKRQIGFVSPELHLYFPRHLTVRDVVYTGLTDTLVVPRMVTPTHAADALSLLAYFDLDTFIDRQFGSLSAGQQRLVLLCRALLKRPPVLIFDEPFQCLDPAQIIRARHLLDNLPDNTTLLFVTHYTDEIPTSVTHFLRLENGRAL